MNKRRMIIYFLIGLIILGISFSMYLVKWVYDDHHKELYTIQFQNNETITKEDIQEIKKYTTIEDISERTHIISVYLKGSKEQKQSKLHALRNMNNIEITRTELGYMN